MPYLGFNGDTKNGEVFVSDKFNIYEQRSGDLIQNKGLIVSDDDNVKGASGGPLVLRFKEGAPVKGIYQIGIHQGAIGNFKDPYVSHKFDRKELVNVSARITKEFQGLIKEASEKAVLMYHSH